MLHFSSRSAVFTGGKNCSVCPSRPKLRVDNKQLQVSEMCLCFLQGGLNRVVNINFKPHFGTT